MAVDEGATSAAAGEEVADLFRMHYASLVRLAFLLLGDRGASEEVVQDAFVKLQLGWRRLREPERAPAWLRSTVLNGARSRLRREGLRRRRPDLTVLSADSTPEGEALVASEHARVVSALRALPGRQREALVLRFYAELSEAETAQAMGVTAGSVKTHVHRGLAALRPLLEEEK